MSEPNVNPAGVIIISDDVDFTRKLMARWQNERKTLAITLAGSDIWHGSSPSGYELILVGPVRKRRLAAILSSLENSAAPVIHVTGDVEGTHSLEAQHPRLLVVPQRDGWLDALMQVSGEALRRVDAVSRARRAEQIAASSQGFAALGRYMIEMRHNVNNALTSVLGNADLLLADQRVNAPSCREQIETIHTMALRLNEIMRRFSSLASEVELGEKESPMEPESSLRCAASGS